MSLSEYFAHRLFQLSAAVGRPFGGIRPRRIVHRLSRIAYGRHPPTPEEFRWYTDRHGLQFKLHPYYLIDREIIAFGGYELPLQRFLEKNVRAGMVCMDVGANMGAMSLHLAHRVGTSGMVFAFEPVPGNAKRIREHAVQNKLESHLVIIEQALSDTDGTLEFLIASTSHVNQGMGSLVETDHSDLTGKIIVQSSRLDSFCKERHVTQLDFIKVDIQGAEPLFLEGATQTLTKLRPNIIMEIAPSSLNSGGYTSRDLLSKMEALGYTAFALTKLGNKGNRIAAKTCPPDFVAENVLFEPS